MSSRRSPEIEFYDQLNDPETKQVGQLLWHDTSDTVHWMLDGMSRYIWSADEFAAMCQAIEAGPPR